VNVSVYLFSLNVLNLVLVFFLSGGGYRFVTKSSLGGFLGDETPLSFFLDYRKVVLLWVFLNVVGLVQNIELLRFAIFFVTTLIANYFFVFLRFSNIGRGMGAPGYFTFFSNLIGFILSIGELLDNAMAKNIFHHGLLSLLGGIFLVSGIYKISSGYTYKNSYGINIGLCNEMWAYKPQLFRKIPPKSFVYRIAQLISTWGEICGGLLLICGFFSKIGSVILMIMFFGCGLFVRLGLLIPQIIFCLVLAFVEFKSESNTPNNFGALFQVSTNSAQNFLSLFLALYFIVHILGEFLTYLYFLDQSELFKIPGVARAGKIAHYYSKYFGTILWRVFTPDITGLHVNIYLVDIEKKRRLISDWGRRGCFRFRYVGEAITVASIFTTLRYWPTDSNLFNARLLAYALTLKTDNVREIDFDVSRVKLERDESSLELVSRFIVNIDEKKVREITLNANFDLRKPEQFSSLNPNSKMGQYG